jgi:hypothetical protein
MARPDSVLYIQSREPVQHANAVDVGSAARIVSSLQVQAARMPVTRRKLASMPTLQPEDIEYADQTWNA